MDRSAKGLRSVLDRELGRMTRGWFYLLLIVVLPVAGWGLLWSLFSARSPRELPVVVIDLDQSSLSRRLIRLIDAAPTLSVTSVLGDPGEGEDQILRGGAYAMVVLPRDLERGVQRGEAIPVIAYHNATAMLPSGVIGRDLRQVIGTVSAEIDYRAQIAAGKDPRSASAGVDPVRIDTRGIFNPELDYAAFLFTALLPTLLQIFILVVTVQAIGSELKAGTAAEWLSSSGQSVPVALMGKLLPYTLSFLVLGGLLFILTYRLIGVGVEGNWWMIGLGYLLLILSYQAIGAVLVAATANLRKATSLAAFIAGPAFAFVGVSFPLLAMPIVARLWAYLLPLTHFVRLQVDQGTVGTPALGSVPALVILGLFSLLPLLVLKRYGRILGDPSYWGRR